MSYVDKAQEAEDRIDDLSRDLTAEIEAHQVTRELAKAAQVRVNELEAELDSDARRYEERVRAVRLRAEKAEASKAELIRELWALVEDVDDRGLSASGILKALDDFLYKHRGQP